MCKLFTKEKIQSKLAQKLLSMLVSLFLMAGMVPQGGRNFVAKAEAPGPVAIPYKLFATADELKNGEIFSLAEENDDKVGRVVFGTRPQGKVKYYSDINDTSDDVGSDDAPTPMTWLIAGWDTASKSSKPGLVLYSEKPMVSAKDLDDSSDSRFQGKYKLDIDSGTWWATTDDKNETIGFVEKWGSYVEGSQPKKVYANHWGASNARKQLKTLEGWFTSGEKKLMQQSTITTTDVTNENKKDDKHVDYTTDDTLYALRLKAADYNHPNNTAVTAGEADDLVIDKAHWGGVSWLRSPDPTISKYALLAFPGEYVYNNFVDDLYPALAAACKINLESDICESVIFASAASAANLAAEGGAAKFSQIDPNAPMYLRLDGSEQLPGATVAVNGMNVSYIAPAGSRLMAIATADDGVTYQFSHNVDTKTTGETLNLGNLVEGLEGMTVTGKAWVEKDAEGQLTYATSPIDFAITPGDNTEVKPDDGTNQHPDWGKQESNGGITHYVSEDGTTSVEISPENTDANGIVWLREESEGTAAWYGIDNSANTFASGSRFYVQWLNTAEHPEAFADIDEETRQQVEGNRGWLFRIGVIAPDGTRYSTLPEPVNVYVQIGDDWDKGDLQGFYIQQGSDENVEVNYVEDWPYPEGRDEFGVMKLNHFSPYFIYDKDTEKEQSNLNSAKTGDELTYVTISGLGLVMILALGLMLNSKINRKKSDM